MHYLDRFKNIAHNNDGAGILNVVFTVVLLVGLTVGGVYGYNTFFSDATDETKQSTAQNHLDDAHKAIELTQEDPLEGFELP